MWNAIINTIIGIWVMVAPVALGFEKTAANNNHIIGPLVVTTAITAIWEVNRSARYVNIVLGIWLLVSAFFIDAGATAGMISNILSGLMIFCLSLSGGKIKGRYGGGWRSLFQNEPPHITESRRA